MTFLLYIDPGTGSMLFSILIGAIATLYFLGRAAILKAKMMLGAKKDGVLRRIRGAAAGAHLLHLGGKGSRL